MPLKLNTNITENKSYTFIRIVSINIDLEGKILTVLYRKGWKENDEEILDKNLQSVSKIGNDFIAYMSEVSDIYNSVKESLYNLISNETSFTGTIE